MTRVPVSVVLGALGVGKTTLIRRLLAACPTGERWAVLVNEFGEVGIDGAALAGTGSELAVEEVAGGCLCCTASMSLRVALTRLLRQVRPDRLLVEPTGLGHPAGVVDVLRDPWLAQALELRAVIALVDPRDLTPRRLAESAALRDQAQLADVLVAAKADRASAGDMARFRDWAGALDPPKPVVSPGGADPAWLDAQTRTAAGPLFRAGPARLAPAEPAPAAGTGGEAAAPPPPGAPRRLQGAGDGYVALGWVFSPAEAFDRRCLLALLEELDADVRAKGLFRTEREWLLMNRAGGETTVEASAHRRDSRVEIIAPAPGPDAAALEVRLLGCRRPASGSGPGGGPPA